MTLRVKTNVIVNVHVQSDSCQQDYQYLDSPSSSHGKRLMLDYQFCETRPLLPSQYFIGLPGVNHR